MHNKRIMVIDDHPLVRSGFRQLIEIEPDLTVCCEAASITETMHLLAQCQPDLAIVDLSLPDGNGLELIKRMNHKYPDILVLVSSMHDEDLFAERALLAGAKGYINKQEASAQVIVAVRQVLNGKIYLSPKMAHLLTSEAGLSNPVSSYSPVERLSNRELEVFELIGHGVTTCDIAEKLHLSVKTIESHRANIKSKLGLLSGGELMRSAVQWTIDAR